MAGHSSHQQVRIEAAWVIRDTAIVVHTVAGIAAFFAGVGFVAAIRDGGPARW